VVGERERGVAELRRGERELLGERGAVEKRKRRVAVKFRVHIIADCGFRIADWICGPFESVIRNC